MGVKHIEFPSRIFDFSFKFSDSNIKNSYFYHYKTINVIEKTRNNCMFRLCSSSRCNDLDEINRKIYMACFCRTKYEKLPFWLNYSTIHNGVAIRLTSKMLDSFIEAFKELYVFNEEKGFTLFQKWSSNHSPYIIMVGTCAYTKNKDNFDDDYFKKYIAWKYESEFRICVKLEQEFNNDLDLYIKLNQRLLDNFYYLFGSYVDLKKVDSLKINDKKIHYSKVLANINLISTYRDKIPEFISTLRPNRFDDNELIKKIKSILIENDF